MFDSSTNLEFTDSVIQADNKNFLSDFSKYLTYSQTYPFKISFDLTLFF